MKITNTIGYFSTKVLYKIAIDARNQVDEKPDQALVSLMFSFNALEAFINETVTCCEMTKGVALAEHEKTYYSVMNDLQKNKASTQNKFEIGKLLLSGQSWDHDVNPYQDFKLLLRVRNELVHRKSEVFEEEFNKEHKGAGRTLNDHLKVFKTLQSKNLIDQKSLDCSWIQLIQNKKFASWCCKVTFSMVEAYLNSIKNVPESNLKKKMKKVFDLSKS